MPHAVFAPSDLVWSGPGRAGAVGRVLFVLEAQRAFAPVAGAAVAAAAAALATAAGANGGNGADILRAWTPAPVPSAGAGATAAAGGGLVTSLSRPMRLAVDGRRGTVYIADTGHHRILEVDVDPTATTTDAAASSGVTGRVRRVIGSPSGVAGAAADGTTAGKALFNRPMGLAVGFDGVLTVADAGNDAVRRIQLYDSSSSSASSSNAVSSALPEQASTGLKGFATTAAIAGHRARSLTLSLSSLSPSHRFATTAAIAGPDTDGDGVVYDFAEVR